MSNTKGKMTPRPYARLITMLGEQLIKNERIALQEIIKNSYDADASWVQVRFMRFSKSDSDLEINPESTIEIEDDGIGMTFEIVKDAWMNPASPYKYYKKKAGQNCTHKGRIMQGEKGIGRYAAFRMGSTIEIVTRSEEAGSNEIYLKSDLSLYDDELLVKKGTSSNEPIFMDNVEFEYEIRTHPTVMNERKCVIQGIAMERPPHGTLMRISNLRGKWTVDKVREVYQDVSRLVSPFGKTDFLIDVLLNEETMFSADEADRLANLLDTAPLKIEGHVDSDGKCNFILNGRNHEKSLLEDFSDDRDIRDRFYRDGKLERKPECGSFEFKFYVFDFGRAPIVGPQLIKEDRQLIRSHRTYIYRDGVRVQPYGDPSDDWLQLDVARGSYRAGEYLSNDQIVGYIGISNTENPDLRDKASREGLMDVGNAFEDLRALILGILGYLNKELKKVKKQKKAEEDEGKEKRGLLAKESPVEKNLSAIESHLSKQQDSKGMDIIEKLKEGYHDERRLLDNQIETVEDLAGVGLAVDAATHDFAMMVDRASEAINLLVKMTESKRFDYEKLRDQALKVKDEFDYVKDRLHVIQPLFRSSRRLKMDLRIADIVSTVKEVYGVPLERNNIDFKIEQKEAPLVVNCPEGILLQVFINLTDNSLYWLKTSGKENKRITVVVDGSKGEVVFADNGPGIREDDLPFIFDAFFSTKGIRGRGLGLYIARQLLDTYGFQIDYIIDDRKKVLSGANFLVSFVGKMGVDDQ